VDGAIRRVYVFFLLVLGQQDTALLSAKNENLETYMCTTKWLVSELKTSNKSSDFID
jgi:hypothetical protein